MSYTHSPVLFGRDKHRVRQFSLLSGVVFLLSAVVAFGILYGGILSTSPIVVLPVMIAVGGAMVHAYLNDGLLVSLLLAIALGLGVIIPLQIGWLLHPVEMGLDSVLRGDLYILVFSFGVGFFSFVIGAGARRVIDHVR